MKNLGRFLKTRTSAAYLVAVVVAIGFALVSCGGGGYGGGGGYMSMPLPTAFMLTSPTSTIATSISTTPTLMWMSSFYETSYTVEVSTTNTFTVGTTISSSTLPLGTTMWAVSPALKSGTIYFWNVTAFNAAGMTSASNGPFTFKTL